MDFTSQQKVPNSMNMTWIKPLKEKQRNSRPYSAYSSSFLHISVGLAYLSPSFFFCPSLHRFHCGTPLPFFGPEIVVSRRPSSAWGMDSHFSLLSNTCVIMCIFHVYMHAYALIVDQKCNIMCAS